MQLWSCLKSGWLLVVVSTNILQLVLWPFEPILLQGRSCQTCSTGRSEPEIKPRPCSVIHSTISSALAEMLLVALSLEQQLSKGGRSAPQCLL